MTPEAVRRHSPAEKGLRFDNAVFALNRCCRRERCQARRAALWRAAFIYIQAASQLRQEGARRWLQRSNVRACL